MADPERTPASADAVVREEYDMGGEAPCMLHLVDDLDTREPISSGETTRGSSEAGAA